MAHVRARARLSIKAMLRLQAAKGPDKGLLCRGWRIVFVEMYQVPTAQTLARFGFTMLLLMPPMRAG